MSLAESMAAGRVALAAEARIPSLGLKLTGQVVGLNAAGAVLSPDNPLGALTPADLAGARLSLSFVMGKDLYRVAGVVRELRGPLVLIGYSGPPQRVSRRVHRRIACELPVQYRASSEFGASAQWRLATAIDIHAAGMRLRLPGRLKVPGRIEMEFGLPTEDGGRHTITLLARVRHGRITREGLTSVGVRFENLSPEDHLVLAAYIESLPSRQVYGAILSPM